MSTATDVYTPCCTAGARYAELFARAVARRATPLRVVDALADWATHAVDAHGATGRPVEGCEGCEGFTQGPPEGFPRHRWQEEERMHYVVHALPAETLLAQSRACQEREGERGDMTEPDTTTAPEDDADKRPVPRANAQVCALPIVGDRVIHGKTKYVVTDITGAGTPNAVWSMRPYKGPFSITEVEQDDISEWPVDACAGTYPHPY